MSTNPNGLPNAGDSVSRWPLGRSDATDVFPFALRNAESMPHAPQVQIDASRRPRPQRRWLLLATVFLATFVGGLVLAGRHVSEAVPLPATARVVLSGIGDEPVPDPAHLRAQLDITSPAEDSAVTIECLRDASAGRWQAVVGYAAAEGAPGAAERVNSLAERIARETAAAITESRRASAEEAASATQALRNRLAMARAALEEAIAAELAETHTALVAARNTPPPPPPTPPEPLESHAPAANPQQVELEHRLAEAERLRESLLVHRTSAHPEVRSAEERIARLRAEHENALLHLSEPPLAEPPPATPPPEPALAVPAVPPNSSWPRDSASPLRAEVDRLAGNYQDALRQERAAWRRAADAPTVRVDFAAPEIPAAGAAFDAALLIALAAAFGTTAFVSLALAARDRSAAYRCALEVQAALPVPVIGVVRPAR